MNPPEQSSVRNRLLALLSGNDYALLQPHLEFRDLPRNTILLDPNQTQEYVYFLESGLASQIASGQSKIRLEVGIYGRDGVGPTSGVLGVDRCPHLHIMQVGGAGYRISVEKLGIAMAESSSLRALLLRFVQTFIIQMGHTALSNNGLLVEQRLARWLAMSHDRLDGNELPLTHEFLGIMIGVRRASVTEAIQILENKKIISARRATIEILDRAKLEASAAESYGVPEAEYRRIIGPL
jgi:CRP-like cAMP-binding protein